jgi:flagellin-specific chaperone FliS
LQIICLILFKNGHTEISNINEETEDEYIFKIRKILQQLENLLEHEERNRSIAFFIFIYVLKIYINFFSFFL